MALSTTGNWRMSAAISKVIGAFTPSVSVDISQALNFAAGVGLGQVDQVYYARPTIAGSATLSLDVATAGGLLNVWGDAFAIAKLKFIAVKSVLALCPNVITLQRPAANGVPLFGAASGSLPVRPDGCVIWYAPDLTGVAVTAATADLIDLVNTAAGNVQPEILILGVSA